MRLSNVVLPPLRHRLYRLHPFIKKRLLPPSTLVPRSVIPFHCCCDPSVPFGMELRRILPQHDETSLSLFPVESGNIRPSFYLTKNCYCYYVLLQPSLPFSMRASQKRNLGRGSVASLSKAKQQQQKGKSDSSRCFRSPFLQESLG